MYLLYWTWHHIAAPSLYAAHLWALADPQGTDTFLHCEANSVMHLPSNLVSHHPSPLKTQELYHMSSRDRTCHPGNQLCLRTH